MDLNGQNNISILLKKLKDISVSDLRTVNNHIIGNSYLNKKIILKNIENHLFLV